MRLLLDSNVFIWWLTDSPRLKAPAEVALEDKANEKYLSAASAWEIEIKKVKHGLAVPDELGGAIAKANVTPLPITIEHGIRAARLAPHHGDPFDRMLIAQAQAEGMTIVTADEGLGRYAVQVLSAA